MKDRVSKEIFFEEKNGKKIEKGAQSVGVEWVASKFQGPTSA